MRSRSVVSGRRGWRGSCGDAEREEQSRRAGLPVTFYKGVDQLPNFEDYGMTNRTYRYFNGKPLYPFGYGLSYTKFSYTDLSVPTQSVAADQPVTADVTVTNTGQIAGDEVVQVYLKFPAGERCAACGSARV